MNNFTKSDLTYFAVNYLRKYFPESSVYDLVQKHHIFYLIFAIVMLAIFWCISPDIMQIIAIIFSLSTLLFKIILFKISFHSKKQKENQIILNDDEFPIYSILLPLYQENNTLQNLIIYIDQLDYPKDKLDVKLLVEQDDIITISALNKIKLPPYFKLIILPKSYPLTKPKALNYALPLVQGKFVTIYDAEDQQNSKQLRNAAALFQQLEDKYICIQARLNYYNAEENILTCCFSLDYSIWFNYLLPAFKKLKLFIPLGGTSNHFKVKELIEIGGWDAFNVTEDADLGVRLFRKGYKMKIITDTTLEQAVPKVGIWIKQRSRWIKGYILTYFVHMRDYKKLYRELGFRNFIFFQFIFGIQTIHHLIVPILLIPTIIYHDHLNNVMIAKLFLLFIVSNYWISLLIIICEKKSKKFILASFVLPFYFMLNHIAVLLSIYQIFHAPYKWEKTKHF